MTSLIDKSFRWIVHYKDGTQRYSNLQTKNDVYFWEKKIGNIDNMDDIIENLLYEPIQQPKWD
ncbi:hypothetical protein [Paenibacillus naphthalenovorans]|uniref:Uncharacterized protein n=1 Tax=Paenibacillus naphthalenovorans TaxID=162209 RepID=A0A0U2KZ26_9BACL|nr:hypothetical protein [Paenibacillus naphthalenovorans]ALS22258.1 hypothetical protein IJ22_18840 [Paenibacillus naphthalenovorans]